MSATARTAPGTEAPLFERLDWDHARGTWGMLLFATTEAMLFVSLFFAYYLLGRDAPHWPPEGMAPSVKFSAWMTVALLGSSVLLEWGNRAGKRGRTGHARAAAFGAVALGALFLALQLFEYRERLKHVQPDSSAYGSIFYTITSVHAAHLGVGMLVVSYAALLPRLEKSLKPPHRPLHNASLYWHFVDAVWLVIMLLLYVLPHVNGP
jgi:heme/copper-type cytochrome/quinol oxidase subunit 3